MLLWRFFSTRRLKRDAADEPPPPAFDGAAGRGVLLTSPWTVEVDGEWIRAPRVAAAFIGGERAEVEELESAFRARYRR